MSTSAVGTVADARDLPSPTSTALRTGALGTGDIVFTVISAAAPLTIVAGMSPLSILVGGIGAPSAYAIAGIVLGIFAVAFMAMTRHVNALGGFYVYITAALGRPLGLGSSLLALLSYNGLQIGLYGLFGVSAHGLLVTTLGIQVPWWALALGCILAVYAVAARGVDVGARVLTVLLTAESSILLIFAFSVLLHGGAEGITLGSFNPANVFNPGMFAVLGGGFAAFMGFESTALYREEARNPKKTIPRATYISVAFLAVFYTFVTWALVVAGGEHHVQGMAEKNTEGLFYQLISGYLGNWAATASYILIVSSIFASQLAFHNTINRYTYCLARDGALPAIFQRTGERTKSPWVAGLAQSILAIIVVAVFAIIGADPYRQLLLWINSPGILGIIGLQFLTSVAVVVYFVKRRVPRPHYVIPAAVLASLLLGAAELLIARYLDFLTAAGPTINAVIIGLVPATVVIGIAIALVWRRRSPGRYRRIGGGMEPELAKAGADA
ncbi:MAG: APC family permease [Acidipropionibacterium sp.]|jgi:amino acid transporter|nr:APC family permease [Acidipropionibacterium sp.]